MLCLKLGPDNSPCIWGKHLGGKALLATLVSNLLLWIVLWASLASGWVLLIFWWSAQILSHYPKTLRENQTSSQIFTREMTACGGLLVWEHYQLFFGSSTLCTLSHSKSGTALPVPLSETPAISLSPCWLWALAPWDTEALFSIEASSASCKNYYRQ